MILAHSSLLSAVLAEAWDLEGQSRIPLQLGWTPHCTLPPKKTAREGIYKNVLLLLKGPSSNILAASSFYEFLQTKWFCLYLTKGLVRPRS